MKLGNWEIELGLIRLMSITQNENYLNLKLWQVEFSSIIIEQIGFTPTS